MKEGWLKHHLLFFIFRIKAFICFAWGHNWKITGGKMCRLGYQDCSEPVKQCSRCGEYDYEIDEDCRNCDRRGQNVN